MIYDEQDRIAAAEQAMEQHWLELHAVGETTFISDVENRTISKRAIMDYMDAYDILVTLLSDPAKAQAMLTERVQARLEDEMQEAASDFYGL